MLLIGLLFVALACLVLGLVLASGPFLIGSLAASVLAAVVLFRQRDQLSAQPAAKGAGAPRVTTQERQKSLVTGTAFVGRTTADDNPVTRTDEAAVAAAPGATSSGDVWVVDGKALFHSASCERIKGLEAEPIPYAQAIEDGFTICSLCKPQVGVQMSQVWVVDGKPDYHADGCAQLAAATTAGTAAEQIPRAQAIEDGFVPCRTCRPDGPAAADAPVVASSTPTPAPPAAHVSTRSDGVWVVDGRPRFHRADCLIIADQDAEEIPLAQATEDGFMPCTACSPSQG